MAAAIPEQLEQFRRDVERLAGRIGAPAELLPTYGTSRDFGWPHIEYDGKQFHFVVVERGEELERRSSADPDEILFHVFDSVTFTMAGTYEVRHRRRGEDPRRQMFDEQLRLLGELSSAWQRRSRASHDEVLKQHPFRDASF